jgi:hypothetical protein
VGSIGSAGLEKNRLRIGLSKTEEDISKFSGGILGPLACLQSITFVKVLPAKYLGSLGSDIVGVNHVRSPETQYLNFIDPS